MEASDRDRSCPQARRSSPLRGFRGGESGAPSPPSSPRAPRCRPARRDPLELAALIGHREQLRGLAALRLRGAPASDYRCRECRTARARRAPRRAPGRVSTAFERLPPRRGQRHLGEHAADVVHALERRASPARTGTRRFRAAGSTARSKRASARSFLSLPSQRRLRWPGRPRSHAARPSAKTHFSGAGFLRRLGFEHSMRAARAPPASAAPRATAPTAPPCQIRGIRGQVAP